jgi:hypothetical protein
LKKNLFNLLAITAIALPVSLIGEAAQAHPVTITTVSIQVARDITSIYQKNLIVNPDGTVKNSDALDALYLKTAKSHKGYPAVESSTNKEFYQITDKNKTVSCVYPNLLSYERMIVKEFRYGNIKAGTVQSQLAGFTNRLTFAYRERSCSVVAAREKQELVPVFAQINSYLNRLNNPRKPNG